MAIDLPRPKKDLLVGVLLMLFSIVTGIAYAIMRRGIESITFGQRVAFLIMILIMVILAGWSARLSTGYIYDGKAPVK